MKSAYQDHVRVFACEHGQWINLAQLTPAVQSLGELVGYPNMKARSLRHFHATVTSQSGQNQMVVSKRLGHASVS